MYWFCLLSLWDRVEFKEVAVIIMIIVMIVIGVLLEMIVIKMAIIINYKL